ncbi:Toxin CaTX-A [Exaiptasia diaphana]|nr:Toxin CaTX-A [Exaiptasia diaphana]
MSNQDTPDKNDGELHDADTTRKTKLIAEIKTKLSTFSGPLSSRAKDSLSSLDRSWTSLSSNNKNRVLNTLGVVSSNIEAYGNAGEDPVSAMKAAINILASISSNFGPKGKLGSTAQGFVSALLGLFGKGTIPRTFGEIVEETVNNTLEEYPDQELSRTSKKMISAFQRTKVHLDRAAELRNPVNKKEVDESIGMAFMGGLANKIHTMFDDNTVADARKAIRYCEMYAQLEVYRDIILTQYMSMIPTTAAWKKFLDVPISFRATFRKFAGLILGKLYAVDYDSMIMPYFDPDINDITDTYSTKMLDLGKYDRSMTGLYCLRNQKDGRDMVGASTITWTVNHLNKYCQWKIVPHGNDTYSIFDKRGGCARDSCQEFLSWKENGDKAFALISPRDPVLWEIKENTKNNTLKSIRNKKGCGNRRSEWCDSHLVIAPAREGSTLRTSQLFKNLTSKYQWIFTRKVRKFNALI